MAHGIREYAPYKGVRIFRDFNVADEEQVYIGNGQGCRTFWFRTVEEARRFIDAHRGRMKVTQSGSVRGLIPRELCENCKNHYSYKTPEWRGARAWNCREYKQRMKLQADAVEGL